MPNPQLDIDDPSSSSSGNLLTYTVTFNGASDVRMGFRFLQGVVIAVTEGGWAGTNGIRVDDRLVAIGGSPVEGLEDEKLFDLLLARPVSLKMARPTPFEHYKVRTNSIV